MNHRDREKERRAFDAVAESPRAARQFATTVLTASDAPTQVVRDFTLVVSELVTNFVEHSIGKPVEVIVGVADPEWWEVEVIGGAGVDSKRVPDPGTWKLAPAERISGRGLGIVRQLMDDVVIDVGQEQVSVRCRRHRDES
jgi:anti-sigma regulatory factor (Ser/Thr protein kinase)